MPLSSGDRLGAYEIISLIGAGGMGEVYRARDTRLERDVALKMIVLQKREIADSRGRPGVNQDTAAARETGALALRAAGLPGYPSGLIAVRIRRPMV